MKYVYVVTVQSLNYMWEKISQECYGSLKSAQHFIEGRSDAPIQCDEFKYKGSTNIYRIYELHVKE